MVWSQSPESASAAEVVREELARVSTGKRGLTYPEKLISVCLLDVIEGLTGEQANRGAVAVVALLRAVN